MRSPEKWLGFLAIALAVVYVGSYVALRCTAMRWSVNRGGRNADRINTYVYFGNGDNWPTRAARTAYYPLHRAEYHWALWTHKPFVYE
jgi:hypothetical protein